MKDREYGVEHGRGSVVELVRETADGLGRLVIQHVKLAQIELTANMRAMASRAAMVVVCAVLVVIGYTLTMTGIAILLGGHRALGVPLVGVGVVHMVAAGVGLLILLVRQRRMSVMKTTASVLGESATALIAPRTVPPAGAESSAVSASSTAMVGPRAVGRESARAR